MLRPHFIIPSLSSRQTNFYLFLRAKSSQLNVRVGAGRVQEPCRVTASTREFCARQNNCSSIASSKATSTPRPCFPLPSSLSRCDTLHHSLPTPEELANEVSAIDEKLSNNLFDVITRQLIESTSRPAVANGFPGWPRIVISSKQSVQWDEKNIPDNLLQGGLQYRRGIFSRIY